MAASFDDYYRRIRREYGSSLPDEYIASEYARHTGSKGVLTDPEFKDNPLGDPGFLTDTKRTLLSQAYAPLARGLGSGMQMADTYLSKLPGPFKALGFGNEVGPSIEAHGRRVEEANRPSANIASQSLWAPERFGQNVIGGLGQVGAAIATRGTSLIPQQITDSERLYEENLAAGMSHEEARNRALAYTPVSLALERLGLSKFLPKRTPGRLLAGLQEGSTEVAQNVARNVAGDEDPLDNIGQAIAGEGLPAGIAAFLLGKSGRGLGQDLGGRDELKARLEAEAAQPPPAAPPPAAPQGLGAGYQFQIPTTPGPVDVTPQIRTSAATANPEVDSDPTVELPAPDPAISEFNGRRYRNRLYNPNDPRPAIERTVWFEPIEDDQGKRVSEEVRPYASRAPVFFSQLERLVDQARAPKATGEQWAGYLKNKGAKNEELAWTWTDEWLKSQTGPVSKEALSDYVRSHKVDVQEVTLGSKSPYNYQGNEWQQAITRAEADGNFDEAERINRAWEGLDEETGSTAGQPKFSQYQLPGGENYRELLLTLPRREETTGDVAQRLFGTRVMENLTDAQRDTLMEDFRKRGDVRERDFRSSHFDQPNVLAHVRFNERTDADGKRVLFIEEIQSDWHQKGRKEGYQHEAEINTNGWTVKRNPQRGGSPWVFDQDDNPVIEAAGVSEQQAIEAGRRALADKYRTRGVPDAPFKNTWPDLSMKRMIRWAAENGFDRVAWTPGDVQADRYDLSKQIDKVVMKRWKDGGYSILAEKNGDQKLLQMDLKKEQLPEYIGKDLAEKFLNSPEHQNAVLGQGETVQTYSGLDLKVGGEGMRGFYDKILVDTANKLGKRFGAKVKPFERTKFGGMGYAGTEQGEIVNHSLDITPAMRESVMQGQAVMEPAKGYGQKQAKGGQSTHAYGNQGQQSLDIATRPDTRPEQVATGNAFMGSLIGWRDRMAGASVLADGLTRDFTDRGFTPLVGQSARSPGDLATLAQVYRDPRVETLRLFVMKGDRIVAQTGLSQRLPGAVSFSEQQFNHWIGFIRAHGGDGYYLLHNHPTGSARPSIPDVKMTESTIGRIWAAKFHGHVIIDHNEYGVISKGPADIYGVRDLAEDVVIKQFDGYDPTQNPRVPNQWLGKAITHAEQLAQVGSAIGANPGEITLITTNGRSLVQSITTFPKEAFSSDNKLGLVKTAARLKLLRAASGSSGYVFAVTENADDLKGLWLKGMFADVVDLKSGESKATGWDKALTLRESRERNQAQDGFLYDLGRTKVTQVAEPRATYSGKAFRAEGFEGGAPPGTTAADVVREEKKRGVEFDLSKAELAKLRKIPARDVMWVGKSRKALMDSYGPRDGWRGLIESADQIEDVSEDVEGGTILHEGPEGTLVLLPHNSVAEPIEGYQRDTQNQFGSTAPPAQPQQAAAPLPSHVEVGGGTYSLAELEDLPPEQIKVMFDAFAKLDEQVAKQRGGRDPRTWSEVEASKNRMVYKQAYHDLINRREAGIAGDKKMDAFGDLVVEAGNELQAAMEESLATGSAQSIARVIAAKEKYALLAAPYAGYKTELGRGLAIIRKHKHRMQNQEQILDVLGDGSQGAVEEFVKRAKGKNLAELLDQTTAAYQPSILDMFREFWINMSLLSGQWTHVANLLSAYANSTLESGVELAVSPFSKDVSTKAALRRFSGMLSGLQMGIANAGKAWRTEQPQLGHQMQMDVQNRRAIPGKFGKVVRIPGRALMTADEFNKAMFYVGELHRLATDESIETGRPFKEVLASYGNNEAKQAEAIKWAERLLFQTQLGSFGRQAMALRDKAGPFGWLLFPFVKTPTNIVKRFGEYAGPLALTMPSVRADIAAGGRNRALSIGRMAMGSAVMASVASMVFRGLMTGAGPDDEKEREEWLRLGYRPYSVKNPLNGEWVRYNRLEPTGMILGIGSDIAEIGRGMDKKDKTALDNLNDAGILLLKSFAKNLGDKTFLRGITDFTQFYADPGRYGENYISNMAATMAVPNILAQNARAMDPYMRDSRSMLDAIQARIPIVRESLPAKLDISGQPIRGSKFEPFASSAPIDDPLAETMLRLGVKKGAPDRDITVEKRKYDLTPGEYESYKGFMQQARWNVLTPMVNSPQFQRAVEVNSSEAATLLGRAYDKIGDDAKKVWLIQHPEVIKKIASQSVKSSSASQYIQ